MFVSLPVFSIGENRRPTPPHREKETPKSQRRGCFPPFPLDSLLWFSKIKAKKLSIQL